MYPFARFPSKDIAKAALDKALIDCGVHIPKVHPLVEACEYESDLSLSGTAALLGQKVFEAHGRPAGSRIEQIRAGLTSPDFSIVLDDLTKTLLRRSFDKATAHRRLLQEIELGDYRAARVGDVSVSDFGEVGERGEYSETSIIESGEEMLLKRYGRILSFSEEIIVNDSLQIIKRAIADCAAAAARYEAKTAFSVICNPPVLRDTLAFHDERNSVEIAALSIAELSKGFELLRKQSIGGDELNMEVRHIITSPSGELPIRAALFSCGLNSMDIHATTECGDNNVFLLAGPEQVSSFAIGTLTGTRGIPRIDRERKSTGGVRFRVSTEFSIVPVGRAGVVRCVIGE